MPGRLAQIRKKTEDLTLKMQKFCLIPSLELFREICQNESVKRSCADEFEIWRLAVLYRWSEVWDLELDPENGKDIGMSHLKFLALESDLCKNIIAEPSKNKAHNILHVFFATGQLKYIDLFYQMLGHEKINIATRRDLTLVYKNIRDLYTANVADLLRKDKSYFDNIGVEISHVDFSHFDQYNKNLERHKETRDEKQRIMESIISRKNIKADMPTFPAQIYGFGDQTKSATN